MTGADGGQVDVGQIDVDASVKPLFQSAEAQGWTAVKVLPARGVRMWCPCPQQHSVWLDPRPSEAHYPETVIRRLSTRTCWGEGTTS